VSNTIKDWNLFFINMCLQVSRKSKDRSTKLGAVIVGDDNVVLSLGYNSFVRGLNDEDEEYHDRPMKYYVTEHAERNAIYNAAKEGIRLKGSTLYLPFFPTPCADCTRAIIQSGVKKIIGTNIKFTGKGEHWEENLKVSEMMLDSVGIHRVSIEVSEDYDIRNFWETE